MRNVEVVSAAVRVCVAGLYYHMHRCGESKWETSRFEYSGKLEVKRHSVRVQRREMFDRAETIYENGQKSIRNMLLMAIYTINPHWCFLGCKRCNFTSWMCSFYSLGACYSTMCLIVREDFPLNFTSKSCNVIILFSLNF